MFGGTSRASLGLTVAPMAMKSQPLSEEPDCVNQDDWISGDPRKGRRVVAYLSGACGIWGAGGIDCAQLRPLTYISVR